MAQAAATALARAADLSEINRVNPSSPHSRRTFLRQATGALLCATALPNFAADQRKSVQKQP
jgi:hypothetical protein